MFLSVKKFWCGGAIILRAFHVVHFWKRLLLIMHEWLWRSWDYSFNRLHTRFSALFIGNMWIWRLISTGLSGALSFAHTLTSINIGQLGKYYAHLQPLSYICPLAKDSIHHSSIFLKVSYIVHKLSVTQTLCWASGHVTVPHAYFHPGNIIQFLSCPLLLKPSFISLLLLDLSSSKHAWLASHILSSINVKFGKCSLAPNPFTPSLPTLMTR